MALIAMGGLLTTEHGSWSPQRLCAVPREEETVDGSPSK